MTMRLFDTHIHLTDFKDILPKDLMKHLKSAGVEKCVCVTARQEDWGKAAKFAHDFPFEVIPCFGLHPWYAHEASKGWEKELEAYLKEFDEASIGECGLDKLKSTDIKKEKEVFEKQIELAFEYNRPLMLHMVKADMWLDKYWGRLPEKSVFHSFSGSENLLKQIFNFNHYVSVNNKFFNKKDAVNLLKQIPTEKLLAETDAPFQTDVSDLEKVIYQIAEMKNETPQNVAHRVYLNAQEVFEEN